MCEALISPVGVEPGPPEALCGGAPQQQSDDADHERHRCELPAVAALLTLPEGVKRRSYQASRHARQDTRERLFAQIDGQGLSVLARQSAISPKRKP